MEGADQSNSDLLMACIPVTTQENDVYTLVCKREYDTVVTNTLSTGEAVGTPTRTMRIEEVNC